MCIEAFIANQRHAGWTALSAHDDDGGCSGGTTERPALQRLLADVEHGRGDCIVVYKVDRLSGSLLDFTRSIETLDRLTLNIRLSFAQFEREIIGERIRDKVAAAKRKGKYHGEPDA